MIAGARDDGESLACWRYLAPAPGRVLAVHGELSEAHRRALQETFEVIVSARDPLASAADGNLILPGAPVPAAHSGWKVRLHRHAAIGASHVVLPTLEAPRWFLPTRAIGSGLKLVTSSRPLVRRAIQLAAHRGVAPALRVLGGSVTLHAPEGSNGLVPYGHRLACSTGTRSALRKATLLELDAHGREVAYGKIAGRSLALEDIDAEARWLDRIAALGLTSVEVPRLLRTASFGRERAVFQSPPDASSAFTSWSGGLSERVIAVLVELRERTRVPGGSASGFVHEVTARFDELSPHLPAARRARIAAAMSCLEHDLGVDALSWAHGDFIDWNLKGDQAGRRLFLFDWEHAVSDAPPFFDFIHWVVFSHYLVGRGRSAFAELVAPGGPFGEARRQVEQALGLQLEARHVRLYALRACLLHSRGWRAGYEDVRERHEPTLAFLLPLLEVRERFA